MRKLFWSNHDSENDHWESLNEDVHFQEFVKLSQNSDLNLKHEFGIIDSFEIFLI